MKVKSFALIFLLSVATNMAVTTKSAAEPVDKDRVVKVFSDICGGESPLEGSGVLFTAEGKVYVLTSEHVVLHGQSGFCHQIEHTQLGRFAATLKIADWGRGTALLVIEGFPSPETLPSIEDLSESTPTPGNRVTTLGFPVGQTSPYSHDLGNILATDSSRHFLAHPASIIELLNSHGEFGMSGGGVFDSLSGKLIAMLSHQYLKMVEGNKTLVGDFLGPSGMENHLLAIPAGEIKPWVSSALKTESNEIPLFVRDPLSQLEGDDVVISDGLRFKASPNPEHCPENGFTESPKAFASRELFLSPLQSSESSQKSKFPPSLLMGGDPVGIGGIPVPGHGPIKIEVSFAENPPDTRWYLPVRSQWLADVRQHLNRRDQVDLSYMLYRNPDTNGLRKVCVYSLSEFFRKLTSPNINPVTLLSSRLGEPLPAIRTQIINLASQLNASAQWFHQQATDRVETRDEDRRRRLIALRLSKEVATVADILGGENWPFIEANDFDRLLEEQGETRQAWRYISDLNFDRAVELRADLIRMRELVEKVRL